MPTGSASPGGLGSISSCFLYIGFAALIAIIRLLHVLGWHDDLPCLGFSLGQTAFSCGLQRCWRSLIAWSSVAKLRYADLWTFAFWSGRAFRGCCWVWAFLTQRLAVFWSSCIFAEAVLARDVTFAFVSRAADIVCLNVVHLFAVSDAFTICHLDRHWSGLRHAYATVGIVLYKMKRGSFEHVGVCSDNDRFTYSARPLHDLQLSALASFPQTDYPHTSELHPQQYAAFLSAILPSRLERGVWPSFSSTAIM